MTQVVEWLRAISTLDVKLGLRMLRKHPGASLVIVLSLSLGIPISLIPHHLLDAATGKSPPFNDGERVVGIMGTGHASLRLLTLGDYDRLIRARPRSFAWIGAALPGRVNIIGADGISRGAEGALISASSFTLSRVPPLLGRVLLPPDEVVGAPEVVVVGYEFWRTRLGGSRDALGTTLRIAGVSTTVVGVMPEGFALPSVAQFWRPLRLQSRDYRGGLGPSVRMYGRLAEDVSLSHARAELGAIGLEQGRDLRPDAIRATAVAFSTLDVGEPQGPAMWALLLIAQVIPLVFLVIAAANAGILLLARTASRSGEVAVRVALGASRARIVSQLFVEALVLSLFATGLGLLSLDVVLSRIEPTLGLPFWFHLGLTPTFVTKALGLSVASAVAAGVLPALRATGTALHSTLQSSGTGGKTLRLGRFAGALIIVEVGLAVTSLFAGGMTWRLFQPNLSLSAHIPARNRYVVASISIMRSGLGQDDAAITDEDFRNRLVTLQNDLRRRLTSQLAVRGFAFSDVPPGEERDQRSVRVRDGHVREDAVLPAVATFVDPSFFTVLNITPIRGRLFSAGDVPVNTAMKSHAAIVNTTFLDRRGMKAQTAIGARIQFTTGHDAGSAQWMEIVGVVPNIEANQDRVTFDGTPVVYVPAAPGTLNPLTVLVDVSNPAAFVPKLRSLVAEADPTALADDIYRLEDLPADASLPSRIAMSVMTALSLLAIVLSTTALYALMSMAVTHRTREIGIRLAVGGTTGRIVVTIARRALMQIAIGVALGGGIWVPGLLWAMSGGVNTELKPVIAIWPYMLVGVVALVGAVALIASLAPTMKIVHMRPLDALRTDG